MTDIYRYDDRKSKIGKRIKAERKANKLSQPELAKKMSKIINHGPIYPEAVAQNTISDWEQGKRIPPIEMLACLAEIFKCDVGYLLCDYDRKDAAAATVMELTGLSGLAADNLVGLHKWKYYLAPFRLKIISDILESDLFSKILAQLEAAYITLCGLDKKLCEHDEKVVEEAIGIISTVNFGQWTKYTLYKGEDSATLQIQNAGFRAQKLLEKIVKKEVEEKKKSDEYISLSNKT